jgi:hypothetical protein
MKFILIGALLGHSLGALSEVFALAHFGGLSWVLDCSLLHCAVVNTALEVCARRRHRDRDWRGPAGRKTRKDSVAETKRERQRDELSRCATV